MAWFGSGGIRTQNPQQTAPIRLAYTEVVYLTNHATKFSTKMVNSGTDLWNIDSIYILRLNG